MHCVSTLIKDSFLGQKKSFLRFFNSTKYGYGGGCIWAVNLPMYVFVNSIICIREGLETLVLDAIEMYPASTFLSIEKS